MLHKPSNTIVGVGVGGAFAIILVWVLSLFSVDMPGEVASAASVILAWVIGYFTPERKDEVHD